MIRGLVTSDNRAIVPLLLRGPRGAETDVEASIDTGYSGVLTLPMNLVGYLDLTFKSAQVMKLGDNSEVDYDLYTIEVFWDSSWLTVGAAAIGNDPLIGMQLLAGHELRISVTPGGAVEIGAIP